MPTSGYDISDYYKPAVEEIKVFRPDSIRDDIPRPRALLLMAGSAALGLVKDRRYRYTWEALRARRDLRLEFVELAYKSWRHQLCAENNETYCPVPALTEAENSRYQQVGGDISMADWNYWLSIATLRMRKLQAY